VNELGEFHFALGRRAKAGSGLERFAQRVNDRRKAVAQQQRPPGENVVDVFVAIDVPDMRSLAACNEWRGSADASKRANR
jgi:hypothetical protein